LSLTDNDGNIKELAGKVVISIGGGEPDAESLNDKRTVYKELEIYNKRL
jgi:hypothetical protein